MFDPCNYSFILYKLVIDLYCSVQPLPRGDATVLTFSDAEETINDTELTDARDMALEQELSLADR